MTKIRLQSNCIILLRYLFIHIIFDLFLNCSGGFFSLARILGEGSTIHSPAALLV